MKSEPCNDQEFEALFRNTVRAFEISPDDRESMRANVLGACWPQDAAHNGRRPMFYLLTRFARQWTCAPLVAKCALVLLILALTGAAGVSLHRQRRLGRLKQMGLAFSMYASERDGQYPSNPASLLSSGFLSHWGELVRPGYRGTGSGYMYMEGWSMGDGRGKILVYDADTSRNLLGKEGRNVLFTGGHTRFHTEEEFQALLQTQLTVHGGRVRVTEVLIPAKASKDLGDFEASYRLSRGQNFKYISPPLRPEGGANFMIFHWVEGGLRNWGSRYGRPGTLRSLFEIVGISPEMVDGDAELLRTPLPGDIVLRAGASRERVIGQIRDALGKTLGRPLRIAWREVDRQVIVAKGGFAHTPIPGRSEAIELYARKLNEDRTSGGGGSGDFGEFLRKLGTYIERRVVDEIEAPPEREIRWHYNDYGRTEPEMVLQHLTEQIALTFEEELRRVKVLFVEYAQ